MRASVAPAPDLLLLRSCAAASFPASANRDGRCAGLPSIRRRRRQQGTNDRRCPRQPAAGGHQSSRPTSASASASSDGQRLSCRGIEQQRAAFVGVALAGRAQSAHRPGPPHCPPSRTAAARRLASAGGRSPRPRRRRGTRVQRRSTGSPRQARGRCPTGRCCGCSSLFEQPRGRAPPAVTLREPREGAASHQLPGRLGDHVVVGR